MGRVITDATASGRDAILITSLLAALAYARWHFWWRTGFGRTRMILLLSIAALTMEPAMRNLIRTTGKPGSTAYWTMAWIQVTATAGVLTAVAYMLIRITGCSIRQARDPELGYRQGRRHLEQTPGATQQEIEKLTACWDEMHPSPAPTPRHPSSPTS